MGHADDQSNGLRCVETWSADGVAAADFDAVSRTIVLAPGEGLPGRVWRTGEPAWIADVLADQASRACTRRGAQACTRRCAFRFAVRAACSA